MSFQVKLKKKTYLVVTLRNGKHHRLSPDKPLSVELDDCHLEDPGITSRVQTGLIDIIKKPEEDKMEKQDAKTSVQTGAHIETGADGHPVAIHKVPEKDKDDKKGKEDLTDDQ
jgi:hypothetical protein